MNTKEAREVVSLLADGTDPQSGEIYPEDSPYQQPDTVRALFVALKGFDRLEKYEARAKNLPQNAGTPWTEEEEDKLLEAFEAGTSIKELAAQHERTTGAIHSRLISLGKIEEGTEQAH
ncbi:MAG TPA: hypothetical protein VFT51_02210 [Bacillales bacterium]|nr:hypothetical protein [Bacillales bacterium]